MSLKGILGGIDVDVILEQYSTDQSPPGLLGTYKRLDGIKGCEYRTSSWHCSPIPVFCFLYSKILPVTKMRLNVCFNEMALFGLFAALIKGRSSYGRNGGLSTREDD